MTARCSYLPGVRSKRTLSIAAIIITCFLLAIVWESDNLTFRWGQTVFRQPYQNEVMTKSGQNYPVCMNLESLENQLKVDESNRHMEEDRYETLLQNGGLNCGNVRVGLGLFSKRHRVPWKNCVSQIFPARKRLLTFIKELCASQEIANEKHRQAAVLRYSIESRRIAGSSSSDVDGNENRLSRQVLSVDGDFNRMHSSDEDIFNPKKRQRGIVYTGIAVHFHDIFQSIYSIRMMKVSLPVEIWVNDRDHKLCQNIFNRVTFPETLSNSTSRKHQRRGLRIQNHENLDSVVCMQLPNFVKGFTSKFYSLLYTSFTDALFIDADNIVIGDINSIFDSPAYLSTGSILWPDLWGDRCRSWKEGAQAGDSSYETHVLFVAHFAGLKWVNERDYAQEAETGQMAFDLTRHAGLIDFGRKFIEDEVFLKKVINGDKDIFRFAHIMTGVPFHYVTHFPGYSFSGHERDCLVHFFDPLPSPSSVQLITDTTLTPASITSSDTTQTPTSASTSILSTTESRGQGVPMFFHQLKSRNPNSFRQILRIPNEYRNSPSACIIMGPLPDDSYTAKNISRGRIRKLKGRKMNDLTHNQRRKAESSLFSNETNTAGLIPTLIVDKDMEVTAEWRYKFAKKLFHEVDAEWSKCGCEELVKPSLFESFSFTF